jgi:hypothetical protein
MSALKRNRAVIDLTSLEEKIYSSQNTVNYEDVVEAVDMIECLVAELKQKISEEERDVWSIDTIVHRVQYQLSKISSHFQTC